MKPRKKQIAQLTTIIRDNALLERHTPSTRAVWNADLVYEEGDFHLYIGGIADAVNITAMQALGISAILNMSIDECDGECAAQKTLQDRFPGMVEDRNSERWDARFHAEWYQVHTQKDDFAFLACRAVDRPTFDIAQFFDETSAFLERCRSEERKVLVHCMQGVNRSACVAVRYLTTQIGICGGHLPEVIDVVSRKRQAILSNRSFLNALLIDADKDVQAEGCEDDDTRPVLPMATFALGEVVEKYVPVQASTFAMGDVVERNVPVQASTFAMGDVVEKNV
eukprot:GEMP01042848.1.p1 GENE.GEMP01042848.1~~GEMP01042848.1.p1  ORF type:complete len:281 (+),score=71.96 GEMP01042848.1:53-895(+)